MVRAELDGTGSWEGGQRADIGEIVGAITGRVGDAEGGQGSVS